MDEKDVSLKNVFGNESRFIRPCYMIEYDEKCNGFILYDNHGYVPNYEKLSALVKGINNFLQYYSSDEIDKYNAENTQQYNDEMEELNRKHREESKAKSQADLAKFKVEYDNYIGKVKYSDAQLNSYFDNLHRIHKDYINMENTTPPFIVYLYKEDKIIHIARTWQSLDACLSKHRNNYDFDSYAFTEVSDEYLNDTYIKALIFNPSLGLQPRNIILQSNYATFRHIKRRYDLNINTIKKIVRLYDVSLYHFSDFTIVEKDKFKDALDSHIAREKLDKMRVAKELYTTE